MNDYTSLLNIKDTQKAIKIVKDNFEQIISKTFNLDRVSAPIIVDSLERINDDLGIENSALKFKIESLDNEVEIVQSLAKWKRMALYNYGYLNKEGIYTDMNAIRPLDIMDNTHSLYVDQWDWELVITKKDRTISFLEDVVKKIVKALSDTKKLINSIYPVLKNSLSEDVYFIDASDLALKYPKLTPKEREDIITKEHKTVFIKKIGHEFTFGGRHDLRAPDYDDWNLNGDLLIWSDVLSCSIELSSMGIRVDDESLKSQMVLANRNKKLNSKYYEMVLNNTLPLTIGGGIGQSRMCMIMLEKLHIAEVQSSIWDRDSLDYFKENNIKKL